ncbi:MAG TPA: MCE family protein [Nitriliruptorales bacterium]|nr:MCE family protein [Nitriliruptorales bacterium]
MLLERRQWVVGLVAAALLALATIVGIIFDRGWITGGVSVTASFTDAAGLQAGDSVLIAGVRAGEVESVRLDQRGTVAARLRVEEPMPGDTRAAIILQNFLGKRAVMLHAGDDWDDLLEDDDRIPVERTSTPVDFAELNRETVTLLQGSDVDALARLVSSVADITEGQRDEVARLLDGLRRVSAVIADRRQELAAAIDRSEDVLAVLSDEDQEIVRIVDAFGSTLDVLARRREDVSRLLDETARTSTLAADLVTDDRQQLDRTLHRLNETLGVVDAHQVDLAHALAYGGVSFEGYANIFKRGTCHGAACDNPYWGNVFVQSLGSAGVDAIAGCGGLVDDVLDQVLGPDPRTCEEQDGGARGPDGATQPQPPASIRSLFRRVLGAGAGR